MRIKSLVATTGIALAATAGAGVASADVQPNLVGGHAATVATPWMASLQYTAPDYGITEPRHTCGGELIFADTIVTNAHCVTDPPADVAKAGKNVLRFSTSDRKPVPTEAKRFIVRIGSHDRTQGGETATVTHIEVNPGWAWGAPNAPKCKVQQPRLVNPICDIAVLKLDHPVNSQTIQIAPRAAQPGDRVELYGWGDNTPDPTPNLPTQLQQLTTKVVPPARCTDAGQTPDEICTDNPNGTDGPGGGDSGGPAVKYVKGIPLLVGGCSRAATQYPGVDETVYTSTPDFRSWIYDTARGAPVAA
ncbi:S1 family peptidase [Amycolatopsis vastitatis]|uniref:S1 family peptidase n=1 Tax=Amycolatopsis vastitatis TaxID=1905142 RepID=UPI001F0A8E82|nr:trypsin-like serine protease [Amycolatopsis vastitatis]